MLETFRRILRFGVLNYWRNGWLSLSATFIMGLTLFIIAVFSLQAYVIKTTSQTIQSKLDMAIYLSDAPSENDVSQFVAELKKIPGVGQIVYLDKQQVLAEWDQLSVDQALKNQINAQNNPLPRTIKIKATDPTKLDSIAASINKSPFATNIKNLSYKNNRPLIQQLTQQSNQAIRNGFLIGSIFAIIAILFIFNTIRIMVRLRQDEMAVMRLVGATDSFIRGPFLVEGALYGILGGLLALIGLSVYVTNNLASSGAVTALTDPSVNAGLVQSYDSHLWLIGLALIVIGVLVSIACTWVSLSRHLRQS